MIPVSVIGASGYTGLELLRLLSNHPDFEVINITSREFAHKTVEEVFGLSGRYGSLRFIEPDWDLIANSSKAVFLCLPNGKSQEIVRIFLEKGLKVIDLSADFRFKDPKIYERTYDISHKEPELLKEAVYGLPEIYAEEIRVTALVGNPGCYPTSILLCLLPLIKEGLIEKEDIIIDSKSGTSGAGRRSENYYSFCEVNEDFKAYKVASHRHTPEIEEKLSFFAKEEVKVVFTPHLLAVNRGILSTIYVKFKISLEEVYEFLKEFYKSKPFVEILSLGKYPRLGEVRGSNLCKISLFEDRERRRGIILSVIDNLIKGASGQAIQNLNLMFGLPEDRGLPKTPILF